MSKLLAACPSCGALNSIPEEKVAQGGKCGKCKSSLFTGEPVNLTSLTFSSHALKSEIPLVVDFWAPWCGPCKMMTPVFQQAALQLEPHYRIGKVNTEEHQQLAVKYQISAIPTIVVFKNGKEAARRSGAMPLAGLIQWIKSI